MIIRKTKSFHKKFLRDLADITIFKNEYLDSLERWEREGKDLFDIGFRKQPSFRVKFVGSYFDKAEGDYVTDIDIISIINSSNDPQFYMRLKDMLKNIDKTPFRFIRFYCGYIKGLTPPWKIGEGDCSFDIEKVDDWVRSIRLSHPDIYKKVEPYLTRSTVSMKDLINADAAIEPFISLTWTQQEIIQGYKIYNSVRYDFETEMINYPRYRVIKFLYEYEGKYCLVDLNFVAKDNSIPRDTTSIPLTYYKEELYKKFKYFKKMVNLKYSEEFSKERKAAIGKITPLAAFVELTDKIKKYNIVPQDKLEKMVAFSRDYARENVINTIHYDEIQALILEKIRPLYEKYRHLISEEYKLQIYIYDIRTLQINQQIPKEIIAKRHLPEYDCSLFPIRVDHIEYLYKKAKNLLLDPYKLYGCIHESWINSSWNFPRLIEDLFVKKEYKIERGLGKYKLYLDGNLVKSSPNLKSLQLIALNGE